MSYTCTAVVFFSADADVHAILGVANGKSETRRDAETGILKSEPETRSVAT